MSEGAGERLRGEMDRALVAAGRELGQNLEWTESERDVLARACSTADRLDRVYDRELGSAEANPAVLVKLSAELRALDRQVVDFCSRLHPGVAG